MIEAAIILVAIGGAAALGLGIASIKFSVYVDPRVEKVDELLPGANCGACGYTGCHSLAEAIVAGEAIPSACIPGGETVAKAVGEVVGVSTEIAERNVAIVHCKGTRDKSTVKGVYLGVEDCRAARLVLGTPKGCFYGCIGFGTCEHSCPFDAIHVGEGGVAVVDNDKCTGCGKCVASCPKQIISLAPISLEVHIKCKSPEKGKAVKSVCEVGCIGCSKCAKTCPVEAIEMKDGLAVIDIAKCISCGRCAEVCPTTNIDDAAAPRHYLEVNEQEWSGCTKCKKVCPVDAVAGEKKKPHVIDKAKCVSCMKCYEACPKDAIVMVGERGGDDG